MVVGNLDYETVFTKKTFVIRGGSINEDISPEFKGAGALQEAH